LLKEIVSKEKNCALAHALLLFAQRGFVNREPIVNTDRQCFEVLESLFLAGKMTKRDIYISAASVRFYTGDISGAAKLLESSLVLYPQDVLVLRLVQDCYFALGDPDNVLRCISRNMHALEESHHLHGHVLAMLAAGYLECGNRVDAEEYANRAVQRTGGRDVNALHTLLNVYQSGFRVSEGKGILERYHSRKRRYGEHFILFNQGCFQVQAGNYVGAMRTVETIVDDLASSQDPLIHSFSRASFLLWFIFLNKNDIETANMWLNLTKIVTAKSILGNKQEFIHSIALMMAFSASSSIENNLEIFTRRKSSANRERKDKNATNSSLQQRNQEVQESSFENIMSSLDVLKASASKVSAFSAGEKCPTAKASDFDLSNICPGLNSIEPIYELSYEYNDGSQLWKTEILLAIESFSNKRYRECAEKLKLIRMYLNKVGGDHVLRDIIDQTMIEAFLRDGQYVNAKLLLCERY
jgi:hypothetical protein